jgi:hypothetical protein
MKNLDVTPSLLASGGGPNKNLVYCVIVLKCRGEVFPEFRLFVVLCSDITTLNLVGTRTEFECPCFHVTDSTVNNPQRRLI